MKLKLLLTLCILLVLVSGCSEKEMETKTMEEVETTTINELLGIDKLVDEFCSNLTLEDYYFDCSNYDYYDDRKTYHVECRVESKKYISFSGRGIGCFLNWTDGEKISYMGSFVCSSESLESTFEYCKNVISEQEQLRGIKIISPKGY